MNTDTTDTTDTTDHAIVRARAHAHAIKADYETPVFAILPTV